MVEIERESSDEDLPLQDDEDVVDLLTNAPDPKANPRRRILGDAHVTARGRGKGRGRGRGVPPLPPPPVGEPDPPPILPPVPPVPEPRPDPPPRGPSDWVDVVPVEDDVVALEMEEPPPKRAKRRDLDYRFVPSYNGCMVLYEAEYELPKGSGNFVVNWQLKCPRRDDCVKSNYVTDKNVRTHGVIEPLAYLHARVPLDPLRGKTHRSVNPSKEQLAAEEQRKTAWADGPKVDEACDLSVTESRDSESQPISKSQSYF